MLSIVVEICIFEFALWFVAILVTFSVANFANTIQECLDSKESVGKLINNAIKQQDLELISKFEA